MRQGAEQFTPEIPEGPKDTRREKLAQHFERLREKVVSRYEQIVKGDIRLDNPLLGTALRGASFVESTQRIGDNFAQFRQKVEDLCADEKFEPLRNGMIQELDNIQAGTPAYYDDVR